MEVENDVSPVGEALARLRAAVGALVDAVESGGLDHLDALSTLAFWQDFEAERRRLPLVDHALVIDAQQRDLAGHLAFASLGMLLTRALRLSPGEAAGRVRAAEAVGRRTSPTGVPLDPVLPDLARAQRAGEVSPEQVAVVEHAVRTLRHPGLDPARVDEVEQTLVEHARVFGPKELRLLARRVVDAVDPDGSPPDDAVTAERRHLELRQLRDGMWHLEGRLTPTVGVQLHALLGPLARPQPLRGGPGTPDVADPRHHGQRLHDALDAAVTRLLGAGDLPAAGGTPTTVVVTVTMADLLARTGLAETSDGTLLTPEQLMRVAGEAEIWTVLTDARGAALALGRTRRLASHAQTVALAARDGGCSFPGCTRPPAWCDRHHILDWVAGGRTDLSNLTLVCRYHHTHFAGRGWSVHLDDRGLPEWVPPRWVDPEQRPLLHDRIRRRQAEHALVA